MNWSNKDIRPIEKPSQNLSDTRIPYNQVECIIDTIIEHGRKLNPDSRQFASKFLRSIDNYKLLSYKQVKVLRSLQSQCDPDYLKRPWKKKK